MTPCYGISHTDVSHFRPLPFSIGASVDPMSRSILTRDRFGIERGVMVLKAVALRVYLRLPRYVVPRETGRVSSS